MSFEKLRAILQKEQLTAADLQLIKARATRCSQSFVCTCCPFVLKVIAELEHAVTAVQKHKDNIWGNGNVEHLADKDLYAAMSTFLVEKKGEGIMPSGQEYSIKDLVWHAAVAVGRQIKEYEGVPRASPIHAMLTHELLRDEKMLQSLCLQAAEAGEGKMPR